MSQHDMNIANQGFPAFRADLNSALEGLVTNSSGATAPSTTFAHQFWVDTAANPSILKQRNADNDAWIVIGSINQTNDTFNLAVAQGGTGAATLAVNAVVLGNGTGAVQTVAPSTSGNVLTSDGTTWQSTPLGGTFTNISYTGTLTGGTGVVNLGSGQVYKDASGNVGIGTSSPDTPLTVALAGGGNFVARFQNTTAATPYGIQIKEPASAATGYPLINVSNNAGSTEYFRVDSGSGNVLINNGYGSAATAYGCRAWVNFNGTGTVAIRASGNVSSITDDGTGQYRVNFTTGMPDTNYVGVVSAASTDQYTGYHIGSVIGQSSTSFARVWGGWTSGPVDLAHMQVAFFR